MTRVTELDPTNVNAHQSLATTMLYLERYEEAEKASRRVIELRPLDREPRVHLGNLLARMRRLSEAESAYRRAIDLAPTHPDAYFNLGVVLVPSERYEDAEEAFRTATEKGGGQPSLLLAYHLANIYLNLARKYSDDDYYEDAIDAIHMGLKAPVDENSTQETLNVAALYLMRGYAHAKLRSHRKARDDFRSCMHKAARWPASRVYLAGHRNLRRIKTQRRADMPRWLPHFLFVATLLMFVAVGYLVATARVGASTVPAVFFGGVFVIITAFALPGLTKLKLGGAELEKQVDILTSLRLETPTPQFSVADLRQPVPVTTQTSRESVYRSEELTRR